MLLLLFPTGKPPTARWRRLQTFAVVLIASFVLLVSFGSRIQDRKTLEQTARMVGQAIEEDAADAPGGMATAPKGR